MIRRGRNKRSPGPLSPLIPGLTARAADAKGSTAMAVTILYAVGLSLFVLGAVWTHYVTPFDEAADNFPTSTTLQLGRLAYVGPELITLSNHPRVMVALTKDPDISPDDFRDLTILLTPESMRFDFRFSDFSYRYPVNWRAEATDEGLSGAWDPWRIVFLGSVFFGAMILMLVFWTALAGIYTLPVFAVGALVLNREISLAGSWRVSVISLISGGILGTAGFLAYTLNWLDLLTLFALFPAQLILGWIWIWLVLVSLPSASPKDFQPDGSAKPGVEERPPAQNRPDSGPKNKRGNPFQRK